LFFGCATKANPGAQFQSCLISDAHVCFKIAPPKNKKKNWGLEARVRFPQNLR
jgi:hypothetical protein